MPTSHDRRASALEILQEHYPAQLRIPLRESARWIGIAPTTARNRVTAGTFPIRTVRFGDLQLVDIRDLAGYLDESDQPQLQPPQQPPQHPSADEVPPVKRSRGRPRKVARGAA